MSIERNLNVTGHRPGIAVYSVSILAAVALLLGSLALWLYLPVCGASSEQIARALLEYQNVTATNGLGALGTVPPASLMLYNDNNPDPKSGPDFAETYYCYSRLGIYFERSFDLARNLPGGNAWTLTSTVRAHPRFTQREFSWTQQLITISNGPSVPPGYRTKTNAIPNDLFINRSLPGTWRMTVYAEENGWNENVQIATNGDYSGISYFVTETTGDKEYGTVKIENGFLVRTITNYISSIISIKQKLPQTERQRILYADGDRMLVSADSLPDRFLLEKQRK